MNARADGECDTLETGMKREARIDRIDVRKDAIDRSDPRGYIRVDATVLKGPRLLEYGPADGHEGTRIELVPAETIEDDEATATLQFSPVTLHHPPEMLDSTNTQKYQIGTVMRADHGGATLGSSLMVTDAASIERVDSGEIVEVSPGYTAEIDETPGEFNGVRYDAVQRNRRYNHLAIVPRARGGRDSALHMDAARTGLMAPGLRVQIREDDTRMAQIMIGEQTFEVPDDAAQALVQSLEESADADSDKEEEMDQSPAAPAPTAPPAQSGPAAQAPARSDAAATAAAIIASLGLSDLSGKVADEIERRDSERKDSAENEARKAKLLEDALSVIPLGSRSDGMEFSETLRKAALSLEPDLEARIDSLGDDEQALEIMFTTAMAMRKDADGDSEHALGEGRTDADAGASDQSREQQRVDAAGEVFRKHRLIGREAMMHPDMQQLGGAA